MKMEGSDHRIVSVFAPAKINLRLDILGKRPDGYHELQSIMVGTTFGDTLSATPADTLSIKSTDPDLPTDETNLVIRAAHLFQEKIGKAVNVRFLLRKRIPLSAGLGGGSSDAAAALHALNWIYQSGLPAEALEDLASGLGADVPFFIRPGHKIAQGIGEKLSPFTLERELNLVLINPGFAVSTAETYQKLRLTSIRKKNKLPRSLKETAQVVRLLANDLESVVLDSHPEVAEIKRFLASEDCAGCLMSGSGPTVFGIFEEARLLMRVAENARERGWKAWACRSMANWR